MSATNRDWSDRFTLLALILQSALFSRVGGTVSVSGRTQVQRNQMCDNYKNVKGSWDKRDPGVKFAVNVIDAEGLPGYSADKFTPGCRQLQSPKILLETALQSVSCADAPREWQWNNGMLEKPSSVYSTPKTKTSGCFVQNDKALRCSEAERDKLVERRGVNSKIEPAVCPCGQDFYESDNHLSYCDDIDECQENHGCPSDSACVNKNGGYVCRCAPGFENSVTGKPDVLPNEGRCVPSPIQTSDMVRVDSFRMLVTKVMPGEVRATLHQLLDGATEFPVAVQRHSNMHRTFSSLEQVHNFTFDGLSPGSRYMLHMTPIDNSDKSKPRALGRDHVSHIVTTKCYCSIIGGDDTGKPDNAIVVQKEGYVTFEFTDNSRCEDAYSFSRSLPGIGDTSVGQEVFASDYYYFSQQQCSKEPYSPGRQAADDLRISRLIVGHQYAYHIRAASKQPWRNSNPTTVLHTVEWQSSVDGQVTLEKAAGLLPVENVMVEYRLEDLEGGRISVCKNAVGGWCRTQTSASGKFKVDVSTVHPSLNNNDEFPLRIRFAKRTGSVAHRFLCDDGVKDCSYVVDEDNAQNVAAAKTMGEDKDKCAEETECPNDSACTNSGGDEKCRCLDGFVDPVSGELDVPKNGRCVLADDEKMHTTVKYLRHLEFQVPIHVIDDTTVPFRGKVTVADTGMPGEGAMGCPIPNAEVCLIDHQARNTLQVPEPVCVYTDSKGHYALPAVVGTTVSPQVNYNDHTFRAVDPSHGKQFEEGILINPDGVYDGFHMQDVTKTQLTVEVAGGLCDRVLGRSEVRLKMQGCEWEGQVLQQDGFRQIHEVIAQPVDIQLESVKGIDDGSERHVIMAALSPSQDTSIDLRQLKDEDAAEDEKLPEGVAVDKDSITENAGMSTNSSEAEALEEEENREEERVNLKRVRFQYDGVDVLAVRFGDMDTGTCGSSAEEEDVDSYSLHVLSSYTLFGLNVFARQDFGYDDIGSCTKYPANSTVTIQNQVGVSDSKGDKDWIEKLEASPDHADAVRALRACSPSCVHPLEMDSETGENARISIFLFTGQPNPFGDLTKTVFVTMDKTGIRHKSEVVVTGDYELAGGFSVALPTHRPLLVLRDPPGGNSYAYYENVISTISLEMEHYEAFVGLSVGANVGFGAKMDTSLCVGFGGETCTDLLSTEATTTVSLHGGSDIQVSLIDRSNQASFTTTWSYQTSADKTVPGKPSDTFLVPNLNVKFKNVHEVIWDKTQCARSEDKLKFVLDSPENKPAIAFLTRNDIDSVEIPDIKRLRDAAQANITSNNCPNSTETVDKSTSEKCKELIANRDVMKDAVRDWEMFLSRHDSKTADAANGQLEGLKPHTWFDVVHKKIPDADKNQLPESHWSGLVPKTLAEEATRIRSIGSSKNEGGDESQELERINLIKFDGGGSEMHFQLKRQRMSEHTEKLGPPHENMQQHAQIGIWKKSDVTFFAVVEAEFVLDFYQDSNNEHTVTRTDETETTIGFVLGDPDAGDVFDVEIFLDPDFGTFIFHTVGGRSRCPVEQDTVPREQPHIEVTSGPSVPLAPDSLMVFEVAMTNQGISPSAFKLSTDHRENGGLLTQMANGDTLARPQIYDQIGPGETVKTTVTIGRGPLLFDNPGLPLIFQSACEGGGNSASVTLFNVNDANKAEGEKERIRFAEPCPKIEWAGDLATTRSFRINKADKKASGKPRYALKVVVRNPDTAYHSFAEVVADPLGRLEDAGLWFRKVGSGDWSRAHYQISGTSSSEPIDFTTLNEDKFGYITVEWDVEALGDGEYEIEARTLCPDETGALPDSFNFAASPRLQGYLDRVPPRLFGTPRPSGNEKLVLGRSVHFEFTELIKCTRPYVFTLEVEVDALPNQTFSNVDGNLHVVCEGRLISFDFDSAQVDETKIKGSVVVAKLSEVQDRQGNVMDSLHPILHRVTIAGPDDDDDDADDDDDESANNSNRTRGRHLGKEDFSASMDSFAARDLKEILEGHDKEVSALLRTTLKPLKPQHQIETSLILAVGGTLIVLFVASLLLSFGEGGAIWKRGAFKNCHGDHIGAVLFVGGTLILLLAASLLLSFGEGGAIWKRGAFQNCHGDHIGAQGNCRD